MKLLKSFSYTHMKSTNLNNFHVTNLWQTTKVFFLTSTCYKSARFKCDTNVCALLQVNYSNDMELMY